MQLEEKLVDPMRNYAQEMSGGTKSSPEEGHNGDIQEDIDFMSLDSWHASTFIKVSLRMEESNFIINFI